MYGCDGLLIVRNKLVFCEFTASTHRPVLAGKIVNILEELLLGKYRINNV